jgi:hypothetical protein
MASFLRQANYTTALKALALPAIATPVGFWAYNKRQSALHHPIMARTLMHLAKDQRVVDFCGENLQPGWWIEVNEDPTQNYIKFSFDVSGSSGTLGSSVIADYLTHRELSILESERQDYFAEKSKLKEGLAKKGTKEAEKTKLQD